ncbi:MAG: Hsp33 family molecular chaperone HslO [Clostridia bacterium]|nr:Hsp33 family molecular chaperone HslO [Clostridia bacterium]NLS85910.1 Hsp33 family molecular chaperone HslO [Oscillospiraceae bacterium]
MYNLIRGISENGAVSFCAVDTTEIVREAERIHKTSAVVTAALGRLLTAASMMGIALKNKNDSVTLRINGGGPAGLLLAVSDGTGCVKGYAQNPVVEGLPPRADGHLDVGGAVGIFGMLSVVKDMGMKEPYVGQVPLVSGEIAEDITSYYAASEQTPTVCALGVLVDKDLSVMAAGGYLIQLMPGADDEDISRLEKNISKIKSVTEMLEAKMSLEEIMNTVLDGFSPNVLDTKLAEYKCGCNESRIERALISLGKDELEKMKAEHDDIEVKCQFCDKAYVFSAEKLLLEIKSNF